MSAGKPTTEKAKFVIMKKVTLQADDSSGDEADLSFSSEPAPAVAKATPAKVKASSNREPGSY